MISIRPATEQDLLAIATLSLDLGYELTVEEVEERFKNIIGDDTHGLYVAETEENIILGWVHVNLYRTLLLKQFAMILGMVVDKKYRRQGIGKQLLEIVEMWAKERHCFGVRLLSGVSKKETHAFSKNAGYEVVRTQLLFKKFFKPYF